MLTCLSKNSKIERIFVLKTRIGPKFVCNARRDNCENVNGFRGGSRSLIFKVYKQTKKNIYRDDGVVQSSLTRSPLCDPDPISLLFKKIMLQ